MIGNMAIWILLWRTTLVYAIVNDPLLERNQTLIQFGITPIVEMCQDNPRCLERCQEGVLFLIVAGIFQALAIIGALVYFFTAKWIFGICLTLRKKCPNAQRGCPMIRRRFAVAAVWTILFNLSLLVCLWRFEDGCVDAVMDLDDFSAPMYRLELLFILINACLSGMFAAAYLLLGKKYVLQPRDRLVAHEASFDQVLDEEEEMFKENESSSSSDEDEVLKDPSTPRAASANDLLDDPSGEY
jgi:hypothetical protein